jgi:hypothetical protein
MRTTVLSKAADAAQTADRRLGDAAGGQGAAHPLTCSTIGGLRPSVTGRRL